MKSSTTYAVSLSALILVLVLGCSSDTDKEQEHLSQHRPSSLHVTLKPGYSGHKTAPMSVELYEENTLSRPLMYSF